MLYESREHCMYSQNTTVYNAVVNFELVCCRQSYCWHCMACFAAASCAFRTKAAVWPCDATQSNAAKNSSFMLFWFWIEFHSVYAQKSLHVGTSFDSLYEVVAYCLRNWFFFQNPCTCQCLGSGGRIQGASWLASWAKPANSVFKRRTLKEGAH